MGKGKEMDTKARFEGWVKPKKSGLNCSVNRSTQMNLQKAYMW